MIWIELLILLACILIGARLGGIALGTIAGIGLVIFVFLLGLPPGGPPGVVIGMIIAVITALATVQAAGGLDYLVALAEKIMRKSPQYITFVAPIVTYILIFASGTTHVIYALLPVIAEVRRQAGLRPERPLSISVIAGFQGVVASPISAATVAMIGFLAAKDVSLPRLLSITIPSTFLGVLIGALSVAWRGKSLSEDEEYQRDHDDILFLVLGLSSGSDFSGRSKYSVSRMEGSSACVSADSHSTGSATTTVVSKPFSSWVFSLKGSTSTPSGRTA